MLAVVDVNELKLFANWLWDMGKFAKDAYVKAEAAAIIAELKEIGINC